MLGWESVYALDADEWRISRLREQIRAGWWPGLRADCATLPDGVPPSLDGGVDLIAAGFSCKDISSAGRGAGLNGASTGPTYAGCLRAIDLWRPQWVFFENSPKIKTRGRDQVWRDLREKGYEPRDGVLSAAMVGAPHDRALQSENARLQALATPIKFRVTIGEHSAEIQVSPSAPWEYHQSAVDQTIVRVLRRANAGQAEAVRGLVEAAIDAESELDDPMPDEMFQALQGDRDACANACRIIVRLTKEGIKTRVRAALSALQAGDKP